MRYRLFFAALVAAGLVLPASPAGAAAAPCIYRVDSVLRLPTGFADAHVIGTDGVGTYVGFVNPVAADLDSRAVMWRGGQVRLLPTPRGLVSVATGVNRSGQVVGSLMDSNGAATAVLWQRDGMIVRLADAGGNAQARDINEAGLIAGDGDTPTGYDPLAWSAAEPDRVTVVGTQGGYNFTAAVTDDGVIAGNGTAATSLLPAALAGTVTGGLRQLASPEDSAAVADAAGAFVVGSSTKADAVEQHAVQWRSGVPTLLSHQPSNALGVNANGAATGYVDVNDIRQGAVWINGVQQPLTVITTGPRPTAVEGGAIDDTGLLVAGTITDPTNNAKPVLWRCH